MKENLSERGGLYWLKNNYAGKAVCRYSALPQRKNRVPGTAPGFNVPPDSKPAAGAKRPK
jgi:hypothetical protein